MYMNKRQSPILVDICDFHGLNLRENNASLNAKNYFLSKSPLLPMSFRDLRLVVTNRIPSNVVILPKTSRISIDSARSTHRSKKKATKPAGYDVYRSLTRLAPLERNSFHDESNLLTNSFTVDRLSPLSQTGYFRTNNLPKIVKPQYQSNENLKFTDEQSDLFETIHRTPTDIECEQTTQDRTRKQIHVFIPTINS